MDETLVHMPALSRPPLGGQGSPVPCRPHARRARSVGCCASRSWTLSTSIFTRSRHGSDPMLAALALLLLFPLVVVVPASQTRAAKSLDIYIVDVEGGNAQLWVTPAGESVLVDTGNAGAAAVRDADRIMAAVKDAGVSHIDHLITTHYHGDHVGGLPELATRIHIKEFIDHVANVQPTP